VPLELPHTDSLARLLVMSNRPQHPPR
jgi:hypothetical protein